MTSQDLFVVPAERHIERLAAVGERAETRTALRTRLAAALLPDVRFADPRETRLALGLALEEGGSQLDLFGQSDPLLARLAAQGGASWVRAVAAIDEAIGVLRSRGATEAHLERVRGTGVAPARARTLAAAMRALDATLAKSGARDGRLIGTSLATAIRGAANLAEVVGARRIRARWLLAWEARDLEWWRALDEMLSAVVILPSFDKPLSGSRERDPLETIAEGISRQLDAAPETETIPAVLGDLATTPPASLKGLRVLRVADVRGEARSCARLVRLALEGGAHVERIAIAYPKRDEKTLVPLRRALEGEGIVSHDAFGIPAAEVPVVAAALHALVAAESLERLAVARVLRSGYVDAPRVVEPGGEGISFRDAERTLSRIARRLETRATASGADEAERLVRTADDPLAQSVVDIFVRARAARTRSERIRAARALWSELGFASRAGRGALATFARDEAPTGVDRAERLALARDVRAWEILEDALETYERASATARERPVDAEVFRLDLEGLLESASPLPNAGRAGAVRVTRLADVAGDELDLLVILDANEGTLPRDVRPPSLVSEALEQALGKSFASEPLAARDLAALAVGAAEAAAVVLMTTTEDTVETPAAPSRIIALLERGGLVIEDGATEPAYGSSVIDVGRRTERERLREGFFLDPLRPVTDVIGGLVTPVVDVVSPMTGATAERALAVTSLERFAKCSFMGYAHVVLGARQSEEQRELPDAREEGNLGHTALAAAFLATREEWPRRPRDRERILALGLAAAEEAIAANGAHAPLRAIVRLRVRESVRAVIERALGEDEWDFILAEQEFGSQRGWPAFAIEERLWLRGSIDRVDRAHHQTHVRVVDYKRSKSTVRDATASLGETAIQVPIYAAVAADHLQANATGVYLPIQPRDLALDRAKRSTRVDELAVRGGGNTSEIERRALMLVEGARAGRFAPLPAKETECTYCSVSGGCRKPRFAMAPLEGEEE